MAGAACRRYGHHLPHRRLQRGRVAAVWGSLHHDHCRKDSGHRHLAKQPAHPRDVRDGIHLRPGGHPASGGGQRFWDLCHLHLLRGTLLCSVCLRCVPTRSGGSVRPLHQRRDQRLDHQTGQRGAGHRVAGQLRCQRDQRDRHRLSNHGPHSGRLFRPGHCLPG